MIIVTFMTKGKLMPTYFRERWDLRNLQTERQPQRPKKAGNRPAKEISPLFMQIICVSVFCNLSCICTGCTLVESLHWLNRTAAANKTKFTCSLVVLLSLHSHLFIYHNQIVFRKCRAGAAHCTEEKVQDESWRLGLFRV